MDNQDSPPEIPYPDPTEPEEEKNVDLSFLGESAPGLAEKHRAEQEHDQAPPAPDPLRLTRLHVSLQRLGSIATLLTAVSTFVLSAVTFVLAMKTSEASFATEKAAEATYQAALATRTEANLTRRIVQQVERLAVLTGRQADAGERTAEAIEVMEQKIDPALDRPLRIARHFNCPGVEKMDDQTIILHQPSQCDFLELTVQNDAFGARIVAPVLHLSSGSRCVPRQGATLLPAQGQGRFDFPIATCLGPTDLSNVSAVLSNDAAER